MIFNQDFAEKYKFFNCISPVDLSAAANVGEPMPTSRPGGNANSIRVFDRVTALVYKAAGTAGDDIEISVHQAKTHAADMSGADALEFSTIHSRSGAGVGDAWVEEEINSSSWTSNDNAEKSMVLAIDIPLINMKSGNAVIGVNISQAGSAGNAQLGGALLLGHNYVSNTKFVEDHAVVMVAPRDLSAGAISRAIGWTGNAGRLRTFTFVAVTGVGTAGTDTTVTFEATDDANSAGLVYKRIYAVNNTSGADYKLTRIPNTDGSNTYTNVNSAENSTIWVADFDYLDIPDLVRNSSSDKNVACSLAQVGSAQPATILGITSGARYI